MKSLHLENKKKGKLELLSNEFLAWLAGFLDGDGSIYVRISKNNTFTLGYQILISVSFTQSIRQFHILDLIYVALEKQGSLRKREVVGDLIISNTVFIKKLLIKLLPYLYIKRRQAILVIEIIEEYKALRQLKEEKKIDNNYSNKQVAFLKVCEKIEQVATLNASGKKNKRRKITIETVIESFNKKNKIDSP